MLSLSVPMHSDTAMTAGLKIEAPWNLVNDSPLSAGAQECMTSVIFSVRPKIDKTPGCTIISTRYSHCEDTARSFTTPFLGEFI